MTTEPTNAIEVFYSYAHIDEKWRQELEKHLSNLKRQKLIKGWYDREIGAGTDWATEINAHLNLAQLIFLLVSPDFMASDYCYSIEMMRAMERHNAGEALVIPIILRGVDWQGAPFGKLQCLPTNAKPMNEWRIKDKALLDVTAGIRKAVLNLASPPADGPAPVPNTPKLEKKNPPTVAAPSRLWNVPQRRNPFFTGRDEILQRLNDSFKEGTRDGNAKPLAISGLGGVGKTQTAIEYAYRYRNTYQTVFWCKAESRDVLASDLVTIAGLLTLPEKDIQDQSLVVKAVKDWLAVHADWLLILDNVEDLTMIDEFLPTEIPGHALLTTHEQVMSGMAKRIAVETMEPGEGALLLLRRASIIAQDADLDRASAADRSKAEEISQAMGGLPLGLDQAGAYMEETGCGLSGYAELYHSQHGALLKRRGKAPSGHPEPVATTWAISFKKVEENNPAAVDLLRLCAFFYPDAIPEEIIAEGEPDFSPELRELASNPLSLNDAIEALLKFSLIRRDPSSRTLSMHRLMQTALKDEMSEDGQRQWAEQAVRTVSRAFPKVEFATWPHCQRYLPHAQTCAAHINQWDLAFPEAATLLNRMGHYVWERGEYAQAESLLQQALAIRERVLGTDSPALAQSLNDLGVLYSDQRKYAQAEPLHLRAIAIRQQVLGPEHADLAQSFSNLGALYIGQEKYTEAEPLLKRAMEINKQVLGPKSADFAKSLMVLANLYINQNKLIYAKEYAQRALPILEQTLGPNHPDVARCNYYLGRVFQKQGDLHRAESLYQRALAIQEKTQGPDHINLSYTLRSLATIYVNWGRFRQAESFFQRALMITERVQGPDNIDVAEILTKYAVLLRLTKRKEEAEACEERAATIRAKHDEENKDVRY